MKKIKVELSTNGIKDLLNKINKLKSDLNNIDEEIVDDMAKFTEQQISKNISTTAYKDGNEDITTFIDKKDKKRVIVGMKGTQAVYNEFGTGTIGENSPHENRNKAKGNLNWYNTGVTIRTNVNPNGSASLNTENPIPLNGLYWTYIDRNGIKHYTQGIPAGKQVFNASISLRDKKKDIIKKKVSDALSKL